MKKLVLVVAMFMFVCGGSFLVKAQNSAEAATALAEVNATAIVNDTVVKDTVTKSEEPVKTELSAPTAIVNDTVVTDTASKDKPAEPVKESHSKNSRNIVCRTIVSTLQKKPSLLRLFRGWLFYVLIFPERESFNYRFSRSSTANRAYNSTNAP